MAAAAVTVAAEVVDEVALATEVVAAARGAVVRPEAVAETVVDVAVVAAEAVLLAQRAARRLSSNPTGTPVFSSLAERKIFLSPRT